MLSFDVVFVQHYSVETFATAWEWAVNFKNQVKLSFYFIVLEVHRAFLRQYHFSEIEIVIDQL